MRTTIEMAREAGDDEWKIFIKHVMKHFPSEFHRFAELIRADERARMAIDKSKEAMKLARAALARMKGYGNTFGYRSNEQNPYEQVCEAIVAIDALAEQPAPVQQEPTHLSAIGKRRVFDYIRGAYDLGYNDARNAKAIPGDSAPGYKGRDVETDHGGALIHSLDALVTMKLAEQPAQQQNGPINEGWQITVAHGHSGYGVYAHMEDYPEEGAVLVQAIEQPAQQEPVATKLETQQFNCFHVSAEDFKKLATLPVGTKLYTSQPQRTWVGLTDEEITELHHEIKVRLMGTYKTEDIYLVIEAKLKEKNT